MKYIIATILCFCFLIPSTVSADIGFGDRGAEVKRVQEHLKWFGYSIKTDGVFGPQTDKAVRHWQKVNGLVVDGVVGPVTANSMGIRGASVQLTEPPAPMTIQDIIREAWPDELEDRALAIAWRESRYIPTAHNSCCHGLFQIYWSIHKVWLATQGVTSLDQLYDPVTNTRMAYQIYLRNGGWGPWE